MPPPPPIPPAEQSRGNYSKSLPVQPVAGLLALLLPGLGHVFLGYRRRGAFIAIGVLGLFTMGMLIGGIDVVDRREDFPWFLGQGLVGPIAFGADWLHQNHFKVRDSIAGPRSAFPNEYRNPATGQPVETVLDPADGLPTVRLPSPKGDPLSDVLVKPAWPPNVKSLSRMNELGMLFGTIAGMMNLICVIDAAFSRRRREGDPA